MKRYIRGLAIAGFILLNVAGARDGRCQVTENEPKPVAGDAPTDPGPLATDLSGELQPEAVKSAMRRVADWQLSRVQDTPSRDWTFAALYVGLLAASDTLKDARYQNAVSNVASHFDWTLGPRKTNADDQAIGQSYLWLYRKDHVAQHIAPLKGQFSEIIQIPDDPQKPVWCGVMRCSWLLRYGRGLPGRRGSRITWITWTANGGSRLLCSGILRSTCFFATAVTSTSARRTAERCSGLEGTAGSWAVLYGYWTRCP